jgi:hypothetical protein
MTKKIVLFASFCLFALSLSTALAEVIPAEYQDKGKDILIMPQTSIAEAIPVPAEFETVDPCPTGCHGGSGK